MSFRTGFNFGLYKDTVLVGVCVFHSPSVPETLKGCFGLSRTEQNGVYELGRLCLDPQIKEKNILSWFVSRCINEGNRRSNFHVLQRRIDVVWVFWIVGPIPTYFS